jgi:hypothetical protein
MGSPAVLRNKVTPLHRGLAAESPHSVQGNTRAFRNDIAQVALREGQKLRSLVIISLEITF